MPHTNSTTHYSLPQFLATDKPAWLTDVNPAYSTIDAGMYAAQQAADAAQADATQALDDAAAASGTATTASNTAAGAIASIAEAFDATATYSVGDYVVYNNLFYRCIADIATPGPWTGSTNWTRATLDSELTGLDAKIDDDITAVEGSITNITTLLNGLVKIVNYTAQSSITLEPGSVAAVRGSDVGYNSIPSGYTPISAYFDVSGTNDIIIVNPIINNAGSTQLGVARNLATTQKTGTITANIIFVKTSVIT